MRKIKFRVWEQDLADGESVMFYTEDNSLNMIGDRKLKCCGYSEPLGSLAYFIEWRYPIMQYIGLKDKNGKEIYKDDIINVGENQFYAVIWDDLNACFKLDTPHFWLTGGQSQFYEIAGDIHQNPELLK